MVRLSASIVLDESSLTAAAASSLGIAEAAAIESQARAEKGKTKPHDNIYPPGTEYTLCQAEAMVMGSVVGVLRESLTEAIRSFYKVRKALFILQKIEGLENTIFLDRPAAKPALTKGPTAQTHDESDEDDDLFVDAEEDQGKFKDKPSTSTSTIEIDRALLKSPTDQFVHSGYRMLHGTVLLLLSLIPPAFSRLLSIVGFRGDRERGLKLLWEAADMSHFDSEDVSETSGFNGGKFNAAIASIAVLGYYSNLITNLDILPRGSYPKDRCELLLRKVSSEYPNSKLWVLEHARFHASNRDLRAAMRVLEDSGPSASLKQVEALRTFEQGLAAAFLHDYAKCSRLFSKCLDLNNWSPATYNYIAGAAQVELYRIAKYSTTSADLEAAEKHATEAESFLRKVPETSGRKKLLARQLPFDAFVGRKFAKWSKRAEQWGIRLVDAVGVSPLEEIIFIWGGHQRMDEGMFQESLERLWWSDGGERDVSAHPEGGERPTVLTDPNASREDLDEHAILALLRGTIQRQLGDTAAARKLLTTGIVEGHKREDFRGHLKDDWTAPNARYELGVCAWLEAGETTSPKAIGKEVVVDDDTRRERLSECSKWLEEVAGWGSYDLDSRMGIKVTTGRETLKKMGYGPGL